jgi:DNA invertase Pin-like site-specific DNA recombinase
MRQCLAPTVFASKAASRKVFEDQVSGTRAARVELDAALTTLRERDTRVVWKLDRLGGWRSRLRGVMGSDKDTSTDSRRSSAR